MNKLALIFGKRIGNALLRLRINSVKELQEYCSKYPFYENKKAYIWTNIGPVSYSKIENYLKDSVLVFLDTFPKEGIPVESVEHIDGGLKITLIKRR